MAKTSKIVKNNKKGKRFEIRLRNRCSECGRPRAYIGYFALCRLCFRKEAVQGHLPGVVKASW